VRPSAADGNAVARHVVAYGERTNTRNESNLLLVRMKERDERLVRELEAGASSLSADAIKIVAQLLEGTVRPTTSTILAASSERRGGCPRPPSVR